MEVNEVADVLSIADVLVEDWGCDEATAREAAEVIWMTGRTPQDNPDEVEELVEELLALLA